MLSGEQSRYSARPSGERTCLARRHGCSRLDSCSGAYYTLFSRGREERQGMIQYLLPARVLVRGSCPHSYSARTFSSFFVFSASSSSSGRRGGPPCIPFSSTAFFTGIGFVSMNIALKSGESW